MYILMVSSPSTGFATITNAKGTPYRAPSRRYRSRDPGPASGGGPRGRRRAARSSEPHTVAGPVPAIGVLGEVRSGRAAGGRAPGEGDLRGRGIAAGLHGDGVAGHGRVGAHVLRSGGDEGVAEEPERAISTEIDRIRRVSAKPARIVMEERIRPRHWDPLACSDAGREPPPPATIASTSRPRPG